jgi:alkylhydroperoxidase family enzyme
MDQRTPSPRLMPLPPEHSPELMEQFEAMRKNLGFIPNSILIMQRKPKLAKALAQMTAAVWDPDGKVDRGFKRIIAHVASRAAGCQYCMAHTAGGALHFGVEDKKLATVWEYQTSPLYSPAERTTLSSGASLPVGKCTTSAKSSRDRSSWGSIAAPSTWVGSS